MAFDEADVERVRQLMSGRSDIVEKRIVGGGWGFMVSGHLCCGVSTRGLTVRVGAAAMGEALTRPHLRRLEFGGRPTAAFVVVEPDGYRSDDDLAFWVGRGHRFVDTLRRGARRVTVSDGRVRATRPTSAVGVRSAWKRPPAEP